LKCDFFRPDGRHFETITIREVQLGIVAGDPHGIADGYFGSFRLIDGDFRVPRR
jgi:hypothetical protein